jgi:S-adenosylmethionine-diacylglycerol 3-amino-3-carboxypropyl transferase
MNSGERGTGIQSQESPEPWVIETATRPVAFAQVREDSLLDQWVVEQLGGKVTVLMVASGGCTAAALATMSQVARLLLVDPNPAQIALSRLKLHLLEAYDPAERLALLGHCPMSVAERRSRLTRELSALNLSQNVFGPIEMLAETGLDHVGRYEVLFSKLREALADHADELTAVLQLRDPAEQSLRVAPESELGRALDFAFDSVMALPNLVGLFDEAATRNRFEPFSRHFARRTRHVLATQLAAGNPYLWQMLQGRFPGGCRYPWLSAPRPERMPEVTWSVCDMAQALTQHKQDVDFVHLSNILDWLSREEARSILDLTWQALRAGGCIFIRQLNSNLDIQSLGSNFQWQNESADMLHKRDRSFFYRKLHLGRKR